MKTSELTGAALNWAVAACEGLDYWHPEIGPAQPNYSSDWSLAGQIIEREGISVEYCRADYKTDWIAYKLGFPHEDNPEGGATPLIAAMRCYVASKLGDEATIPNELMEAA